MEWTVCLYKQDKKKTISGLILMLLLLIFLYWILDLFWAILAALLFSGSVLLPFFMPISYRLNNEELSIKKSGATSTYQWDYFKRYHILDDGIWLSPFEQPRRLDNFRGIFLRFSDNSSEVEEFIKSKITPTSESLKE